VRLLNDLLDSPAATPVLTIKPRHRRRSAGRGRRTMRPNRGPGQALTRRSSRAAPRPSIGPDCQVLVNLLTNAHEYAGGRQVTARVTGGDDWPKTTGQEWPLTSWHIFAPSRGDAGLTQRRRHRPRPGDLEIAGRAARGTIEAERPRAGSTLPRPPPTERPRA
jgi:hypothetical protein